MNITFVSDAIYPYNKGGKEKRLYELSTRLARNGHDVHIYTMHWWDTPEQSRLEDGVRLHAISRLWPMYKGDRRSIKEGLLFGLACLRLFRVKFDILDVDHMPFFPIYSAWLVCLLRRKRLHGTWHEALSRQDWIDYMGKPGVIASFIEHCSIRLPYHITATCLQAQQGLTSIHGRSADSISLVTPGIDTVALAKLKPSRPAFDILYAGRLVKGKHLDVLIRAIALLHPSHPKLTCRIVGHGVEWDNLQALITELKLGKSVHLEAPLVKDTDVYAAMMAAKVFCLPSSREGFGMVVVEALGCGTPVVTIDTPSNNGRFHVQDGENGSLVALTPEGLASGLKLWLDQPKPKRIADSVRQYDWESLAKKQVEVYAI